MSHNLAGGSCSGCGIPLSDGYVIGCQQCSDRRRSRLRRGEILSPTGFPGERLDNRTSRGRIIAHA